MNFFLCIIFERINLFLSLAWSWWNRDIGRGFFIRLTKSLLREILHEVRVLNCLLGVQNIKVALLKVLKPLPAELAHLFRLYQFWVLKVFSPKQMLDRLIVKAIEDRLLLDLLYLLELDVFTVILIVVEFHDDYGLFVNEDRVFNLTAGVSFLILGVISQVPHLSFEINQLVATIRRVVFFTRLCQGVHIIFFRGFHLLYFIKRTLTPILFLFFDLQLSE